MNPPDLNGLALFVDIINHGSITSAANASKRPKSTLSRQLSEFEERLGVRLIDRTTRTLALTEAGKALYDQAGTLVEELSEIQTAIGAYQRHPKGDLSLLWPQELFTEQMADLITEFLDAWPQINIQGTQYVGYEPSLERHYDLHFILHQRPLPASDWIARSLMSIPVELYMAPFAQFNAPTTLKELSHSPCILQSNEHEWLFRRPTGSYAVPVLGRLTLNSPELRMRAAIRGQGIVRLPAYLAESAVRQGALKPLNFADKPLAEQLTVVYRSRQLPLKTRLFLEHFQNHIGRLYSRL